MGRYANRKNIPYQLLTPKFQTLRVYELEDILNGKREFYFINVFGGNYDFIRMLSKK
jgi:hypothetical protein